MRLHGLGSQLIKRLTESRTSTSLFIHQLMSTWESYHMSHLVTMQSFKFSMYHFLLSTQKMSVLKTKKTNKLFHRHSAPERAEIPKQHILGSPRMPLQLVAFNICDKKLKFFHISQYLSCLQSSRPPISTISLLHLSSTPTLSMSSLGQPMQYSAKAVDDLYRNKVVCSGQRFQQQIKEANAFFLGPSGL